MTKRERNKAVEYLTHPGTPHKECFEHALEQLNDEPASQDNLLARAQDSVLLWRNEGDS